jgi:hypothetical protein
VISQRREPRKYLKSVPNPIKAIFSPEERERKKTYEIEMQTDRHKEREGHEKRERERH